MPEKSKYYAVKQQIEAMILKDEFPVGSQLPSEPELTHIFNVSRGTIRQALSALARDAVIARRSGSGTFVIRKPSKSAQVMSLTQQIRAAGMASSVQVLAADRIMASQAEGRVSEAFMLRPEQAAQTPVYRIDRLRYGNDQPLARQTLYLLVEQFRTDLLERENFAKSMFSLYARYHRRVVWADEVIQARQATPTEIKLLVMHDLSCEQQLVYVRERISYDQENLPLEVMTSVDRGIFFQAYRYRIVEDEPHLRFNPE